MKVFRINKITLTGLILLIVAASSSAYAWGIGGGCQCGDCPCPLASAWGISGGCQGGGFPGRLEALDDLTAEQKNQLTALRQKFMDDTAETRISLNTASRNLAVLMETSEPDKKAVKSLIKEISELNATLMEKQVNHQLEVRKIAPGLEPGNMSRRCPKADKSSCMRGKTALSPGGCGK